MNIQKVTHSSDLSLALIASNFVVELVCVKFFSKYFYKLFPSEKFMHIVMQGEVW